MRNFSITNLNIRKCGGIFDKKSIQDSISKLQLNTIRPDFWVDSKSAQATLKEISRFENEIKMWEDLDDRYGEVESYLELLNEGENILEDAEISINSFSDYFQ